MLKPYRALISGMTDRFVWFRSRSLAQAVRTAKRRWGGLNVIRVEEASE